jgi:Phosphotransferase enzyme family
MPMPEPMKTSVEPEQYRLLILRRKATELLVTAEACRFSLPEVEIPKWERIAPLLSAAVTSLWGFEAYSLFTVSIPPVSAGISRVHHQVMHASSNHNTPKDFGWYWVPVASLSDKLFTHPEDYQAMRSAFVQLESYASKSVNGPFGKPNSLQEVFEWAEHEIAPLGLSLNGKSRQLNASPTFSLIRMETNGPALWFKAVGEPNVREYPITLALARLFPAFVPTIIAKRDEWNAWLATEAEGTHPDESSEIQTWIAAAKALADLQLTSVGRTLHLIGAGCRDARPSSLLELVHPFLDVMAGLMEQQTVTSPAPLSRTELRTLAAQLQDALLLCANSGIPNALSHLDFNDGNILVSENRCTFLDWAEACVGHPFITFEYLLEHMRRLRSANNPWEPALASAYVKSWRPLVEHAELSTAISVAPLLAAFTYAAAGGMWRNPDRITSPDLAKHLRSLTRRIKREADRWAGERAYRSLPCLG